MPAHTGLELSGAPEMSTVTATIVMIMEVWPREGPDLHDHALLIKVLHLVPSPARRVRAA
jgi:hypothetical protein